MSLNNFVVSWNAVGEIWTQSFIRACWQGGLAVCAVWLTCHLLRRLPAGLRCLLWWLVCLKLVVGLAGLAPIEISLGSRSDQSLPLPTPPPLIAASVLPASTTASPLIAAPPILGNVSSSPLPFRPPASSAATALSVSKAVSIPTLQALLLAIWILAVLAGLYRLILQGVAAYRLVRYALPLSAPTYSINSEIQGEEGVRQASELKLGSEIAKLTHAFRLRYEPGLRLSSQTQSPLLVGLLRPVILLPIASARSSIPVSLTKNSSEDDSHTSNDNSDGSHPVSNHNGQSLHAETLADTSMVPSAIALTPDESRMALAHELAHIRRGDLWLGLLPTLMQLLFCFYPLAWLAYREYTLAREEACDAEALQTLQFPLDAYGRLLLKFVVPDNRPRSAIMLGAASSFSHLQRRLKMLQRLSTTPVSPAATRRMRLLAYALLIIGGLSAVPWRLVGAQEAVTPFGEDARLDQRIAVNAEGVPVEDILDLLSRETHITFLADRETRDDKLICVGPARPLRDLLTDLAALFGDRWTQSKGADGKALYRLTRDARIRDYEDRLANQMNARMMAELDKQAAALHETPDQLKQRPAEDMIRHMLSHDDSRIATQFYGLLSAQQKQELFAEGHTESIPFKALTPDQQQLLRQWFASRIEAQKKMAAANNYTVKIGNSTISSTVPVSRMEDLEQGIARFDINGESAGTDTNIMLRVGGMNVLELRQFVNSQRSLLAAHGDPYTGKPVATRTALPPETDVRASQTAQDWRDKLRQLADRAHISIMADYYRAAAPVAANNQSPADAAPPEFAALDTLCRPDAYLWWVRGKTLLLRKREWYLHRQYETPDRWARETARRLEAVKGVPTYADLFRLTELTPRQITGLQLAQKLPFTNRDADGLLNLLTIMRPKVINERHSIAGATIISADHRSVVEPAEAEAIIVNEPGVLPDTLRRYLKTINSPIPADLTGLKILTFYSYLGKRNDNIPAHKAFIAAQQKQMELHKTASPEDEEVKRMDAEVTKLMSEDMDVQMHSKTRDERFVYVNLTAILLQRADDPTSPQSSITFSFPMPANIPNSDAPLRVSEVHHSNSYHVILPRSLAGDRSDRTRIENEAVHSATP